ncbi:MAG: hypothetical protein E2O46_02565 [Ignavibacteria bacterium]|nr:MAG: hypothetical protein E2O46_02565 [Ignavibacteria bacterium]
MKYPLSIIVIIIFIIINFISCSDDPPTSIGIDLLDGDFLIVSTFDTQDDSVTQFSSFFKEVVPLGLSSKVLIGKRDELEATALMDFAFFIVDSLQQDFLDGNITVNQAFIELTPQYTYTDTNAAYDFTVHQITSNWSLGFTSDSLANLTYDQADLSSNKNFTDSIYTFDLDNDFVLQWIKNSIDSSLGENNGIYYKPTMSTGKVVGFQALTTTSTDAAKLKVVIEKQGSFVDTIRAFIFADVSAVEADLPVLPVVDIGVQASVTIQSKLFFDLSEVPPDIVINKAELILTEDTLSSITGSSFDSNLLVFKITDSSDVTIDEGIAILLSKKNNIYTGDITSFVTSWINNEDNQGIVVQPASLIEGLELFAIRGSEYPELSERPRLRIVFTSKE